MAKKKDSLVGTIIFVAVIAIVIVGAFLIIANRGSDERVEIEAVETEAAELIDLNLDGAAYPATPREVLKLYCRLVKCLYSADLSDRETEKLVAQIRKLYSDELLYINPESEMVELAKNERDQYLDDEKVIYSYTVDSVANMDQVEDADGSRVALNMYFTIKTGSSKFDRSYERFILKQQENGRYKILGWKQITSAEFGKE